MNFQLRDEALDTFRSYKKLAEKALAQVSDEEFFRVDGEGEANSIAAVVKHVGGNLKSRWTDFLTTDGEKPDRDRDSEFVTDSDTRESLAKLWESGWEALFSNLGALTEKDFATTVTIRGEPFTVTKAILRSISHIAYHVGQIVLLARSLRGDAWRNLSIPRGRSQDFNAFLGEEKPAGSYLDAVEKFK